MSWIREYTKASYPLFAGNSLEAFQPLDFYHFYPIWYGVWIHRIVQALEKTGRINMPYSENESVLPVPSNMRALLQKIIPSYVGMENANKEDLKKVANFFARMLMECCTDDPFGKTSTPKHDKETIDKYIDSLEWQNSTVDEARQIGRLITVAGSLVHALYNDLATDFGWEAYGPYKTGSNDETLLIREFPDLSPEGLWGPDFFGNIKTLQIYSVYQGVEWEISCVGCHAIPTAGSPVQGMKRFVVKADSKVLNTSEIQELIENLADKANKLYQHIKSKDFEELKEMVVLQEHYQTKKLFEDAGFDWRPSKEILEKIKGRELLHDVFPRGQMMTNIKDYAEIFGFNKFAKEVLGEKGKLV